MIAMYEPADRQKHYKVNARLPSERLELCPHDHVRYMGEEPGTGPLVCLMCGARMLRMIRGRYEP